LKQSETRGRAPTKTNLDFDGPLERFRAHGFPQRVCTASPPLTEREIIGDKRELQLLGGWIKTDFQIGSLLDETYF
jgi:hypothetical protein